MFPLEVIEVLQAERGRGRIVEDRVSGAPFNRTVTAVGCREGGIKNDFVSSSDS